MHLHMRPNLGFKESKRRCKLCLELRVERGGRGGRCLAEAAALIRNMQAREQQDARHQGLPMRVAQR